MTAIHTNSMTMTQTLYSVHTLPDAGTLVATLRDECARVLATHGSTWPKAALNDLVGLDSTIRESMRFSDLEPFTVARKLINKAGIDLNVGAGAKMYVLAGVNVCLPVSSVYRGSSIYSSADEFQPFRFVTLSSTPFSTSADNTDTKSDPISSAVTASPRFLALGHGRHACPAAFSPSSR